MGGWWSRGSRGESASSCDASIGRLPRASAIATLAGRNDVVEGSSGRRQVLLHGCCLWKSGRRGGDGGTSGCHSSGWDGG